MSGRRTDCEHGHGAQVLKLAQDIGEAHGMEVESAILVVIGPDGQESTVIGSFNTTALMVGADLVLEKAAEHEPDGCAKCDTAAKACEAAISTLRTDFRARLTARGRH